MLQVIAAAPTPTPRASATAVPVVVPTPIPGAQQPHTATLNTGLGWVLVFLLILLTVLFLSMALARWKPQFFNLPYSSWYALHNDVAVAALILVTILGLTGTINGEVISGLFACVVGYVLGNVGGKSTGDALASPVLLPCRQPRYYRQRRSGDYTRVR